MLYNTVPLNPFPTILATLKEYPYFRRINPTPLRIKSARLLSTPSTSIPAMSKQKQPLTAEEYYHNKLTNALLNNSPMSLVRYQYELEEQIEELQAIMHEDSNDLLMAITENTGDVAMLLLLKDDSVYCNEDARDKLRELWKDSYEYNIQLIIPGMVEDLCNDCLPMFACMYVTQDERSQE